MQDIFTPLTDAEIEQLEEFFLQRFDEDTDTRDRDEGIYDVSSLDGFFTAIVSGPSMIPPSQWMPSLWGDFEPEWKNEKDFAAVFSLLMRHMNSIASHLMNEPESFEPMFSEHIIEGQSYIVVDDWCFGYVRGIELADEQWGVNTPEMNVLLLPIMLFGTEQGWDKQEEMDDQEIENQRLAITPNVQQIHAYWLARRKPGEAPPSSFKHSEAPVGRNDLCPCGSGKKYKKCCLH
jgi:uncharacterized protein